MGVKRICIFFFFGLGTNILSVIPIFCQVATNTFVVFFSPSFSIFFASLLASSLEVNVAREKRVNFLDQFPCLFHICPVPADVV